LQLQVRFQAVELLLGGCFMGLCARQHARKRGQVQQGFGCFGLLLLNQRILCIVSCVIGERGIRMVIATTEKQRK